MKRSLIASLGVAWLLATGTARVQADSTTNDILAFANQLYAQKEYYRAITEYKRFIFLAPSNSAVPAIEFQIGMACLEGGKYEAAVEVFTELADRYMQADTGPKSLRMVAETRMRMNDYPAAQAALESFIRRYPGRDADPVRLQLAWCLLCQGETRAAQDRLRDGSPDAKIRGQCEALTRAASDYDKIPLKSPALAGCLSAALPGAGQVYVGRPRDGLLAFAINGCLIFAAVEAFDKDQAFAGGLFALLDVSWYAGTIYNAVNSANKVNRDRRHQFLNDVEIGIGITRSDGSEADSYAPLLALTVAF